MAECIVGSDIEPVPELSAPQPLVSVSTPILIV
jgi:hypothetical protein